MVIVNLQKTKYVRKLKTYFDLVQKWKIEKKLISKVFSRNFQKVCCCKAGKNTFDIDSSNSANHATKLQSFYCLPTGHKM